MATALFSSSWYRVSELKPRLRKHVEIHRHDYRGRVWFVLQDHASGRSHRLSPAAYHFVGLMNGERSVQKLWEMANEQLKDKTPTQDETIRLLGQLHAADTMLCDTTPDSRELFRRYQRVERMKVKQKIWSPLAVRIPIWDPDRFLNRTKPYIAPIWGWPLMWAWIALVTTGIILAFMHFGAITENIFDRALQPSNLLVLWLVYPIVKALHELGHGYAVKMKGGEVHEIGIMFLVLIPVPYVDASAASGFRDKYDRMLVGAIGIMVEMALASIALIVWLNASEGPVHVIAYNVMIIGGVSTVLFNGNPLLRFDGYYVLADLIEIPNLGTRENKYLGYLMQKYVFRSKEVEPVTSMNWERFWFIVHGIAAFFYRMFIMFAIILYISGKFFFVGIILALWAITTQAVVPIFKGVKFLMTSPKVKSNRPRAIMTTMGMIFLAVFFLFIMPFPHRTMVEGVTWPPDSSQVRAKTEGFIISVPVSNRSEVTEGDPLMMLEDPFLSSRVELLEAHIKALELQRSAQSRQDRVEEQMIMEEIKAAQGELDRTKEDLANLTIRAPRSGIVILPNETDLPGRFMRRGTLSAYVVNREDQRRLRLVVNQNDVGLVRDDLKKVIVMPAGWDASPIEANIVRETPGGSFQLPTASLGILGGGDVPVDPRDPEGVRTMERYFEFELQVPEGSGEDFLGRRVTVKLKHGYKPVGLQLWTALRQLFLRLYNV